MMSWFKEKNIRLETVEQNYDLTIPENYLPYIIQVALPQIENERRGLNTKAGMRQAAKEGRFPGKAPIGYLNDRVNKAIIIDVKRAHW